jgi:1-acyl-sn-glycerol-3-phosphate acyltransferase
MKPPLRYRVLKQYVRFGLQIFFRQWQTNGAENIPPEGPLILVANHQNAFLEALLVVCGSKRNPWFLARGDVFRKKWATRLLTFLQIKPIFRFRDGHGGMRQNERILGECVSLLKQGECVLIFGEGDHNEPWTFTDLQRGFAQIALHYMEQTQQDIHIVPVGFHFERHHDFRSRVLVSYGNAFSAKEITHGIANQREKYKSLQVYTGERLKELILTIPNDQNYLSIKNYLLQNRLFKKTMIEQLDADRKLVQAWNKQDNSPPQKKSIYQWFNPLYLYGRFTHLPTQVLMDYIVKKKIKDDQFIGSVKAAVGIFLVPAYYILITLVFYWLAGDPLWTLVFFISLPVSGLFAYDQQ